MDLGLEVRSGGGRRGRADTFLAFVEDGRARVVGAGFVGVREFLATAFVDAFEGHCGWGWEMGLLLRLLRDNNSKKFMG